MDFWASHLFIFFLFCFFLWICLCKDRSHNPSSELKSLVKSSEKYSEFLVNYSVFVSIFFSLEWCWALILRLFPKFVLIFGHLPIFELIVLLSSHNIILMTGHMSHYWHWKKAQLKNSNELWVSVFDVVFSQNFLIDFVIFPWICRFFYSLVTYSGWIQVWMIINERT